MNFLLDTGSQISLINLKSLSNSDLKKEPESLIIKGLGFRKQCNGSRIKLDMLLPNNLWQNASFFAINDMDIAIELENINQIIRNLKEKNIAISKNFPSFMNNRLRIDGIIGSDVLPLIGKFAFVEKCKNTFVEIDSGLIPIGKINNLKAFLNEKPTKTKVVRVKSSKNAVPLKNKFSVLDQVSDNDFECQSSCIVNKENVLKNKKVKKRKVKKIVKVPFHLKAHVNAILNPIKKMEQVSIFPEDISSVEQGLDDLLNIENLGIKDESTIAYTDTEVDKFKNSVEFKDGKYFVSLPWRQEVLSRVPSNFGLSKIIAQKVSLKNGKLDEKYWEVFMEQLNLGIIQKLDNFTPSNHKWIPHRAIVREDPLVKNTKIRPVFNCSFRTKNFPSLNQAAFPGIDMLNNLQKLLLQCRANKYFFMADIQKAFLNIFLKDQSDKNCFSFVVFYQNKFHYFQYNSIIFGFICSPFILNFIIQMHAEKLADKTLSSILKEQIYVDNLFLTDCNLDSLAKKVETITSHMKSAHFFLREFVCNNEQLSVHLNTENNDISMDPCKMLGYIYEPKRDIVKFKVPELDLTANSKRKIFSQIGTLFDPEGYFTPLLIPFKLLMREITMLKTLWDETLPVNITEKWIKLVRLFNKTKDDCLQVPRIAYYTSSDIELVVYSDASKFAYGSVIYARQGNESNLIFSKSKLAPFPSKTLPTLELMAVYLSVKLVVNCIDYFKCGVKKVIIYTDSQVCLTWVLSKIAARKNVFVNNRLREIMQFEQTLKTKNIELNYLYVNTSFNTADLLTKEITPDKFYENRNSWFFGPKLCPEHENVLGCIPHSYIGTNNQILQFPTETVDAKVFNLQVLENNIKTSMPEGIINFERFSSYHVLFKSIFNIYKAISLFKRSYDINKCKSLTFKYLIKIIQKTKLVEEINFLESSPLSYENVPKRVKNFSLFLDQDGIVRSKGRVGKAPNLTYNNINPIFLPTII